MEAKNYIVHDVFLVAYFIAGLTGNTAVLLVCKTKLKKESESRYFIPHHISLPFLPDMVLKMF
jgi:hypothetical protein